jgi:rhamnosyltransferase
VRTVTVAIPVRNGGAVLEQTLDAVASQQIGEPATVHLLVCDSGSSDGSVAVARSHGAELIEIDPSQFSHGGTRNLMMQRAEGEHVAFLTQDAVPADEHWLARLLSGFSLAPDVGLAFGPYLPRSDASAMVARELTEWFRALSPDGSPQLDLLSEDERDIPVKGLLGRRGFFTDANGCVARAAWESVPFRPVSYSEDHVLAHDMLRAGFAKAYVPSAAVIHSHDYSSWEWLRRSFDEARAMHEVYGFDEPGQWRNAVLGVRGRVGADMRWSRRGGASRIGPGMVAQSAALHLMRAAGTMLGTRAERLPDAAVRRLSLEKRLT